MLRLWCLQVRAALREGRIKELLAADELGIMIRSKRAFEGWKEGAVKFPPTFKYKRGASHYLGECSVLISINPCTHLHTRLPIHALIWPGSSSTSCLIYAVPVLNP